MLAVLDIKSKGTAILVLEEVKRRNMMDRLLIASFDPRDLMNLKKKSSKVALGLILGFSRIALGPVGCVATLVTSLLPIKAASWIGARAVLCSQSKASQRFVRRAHSRQLAVIVWTNDSARDLRRLVEAGVDGIISDEPDKVRRLIAERRGSGTT